MSLIHPALPSMAAPTLAGDREIPAGASRSGGLAALARHARPLAAAGLTIALLAWFALGSGSGLSSDAQFAICVLALAIIGWTLTDISDTAVALVAGIALIIGKVVSQDEVFGALGNELIWLLVASFMLAACFRESGLVERAVLPLLARARTVAVLLRLVTLAIAATALFVPSTSGRAALMLPVFLVIARAVGDARLVRALALTFPTAILLSAAGTLIGAGAHLIAADFIRMLTGRQIGFLGWMALAGPFALATTLLATEIIMRLFLTRQERRAAVALAARAAGEGRALNVRDIWLCAVVAITVGLWMTASQHGIGIGLAAMMGALAATSMPGLSLVSLKKAVKAVEWDLLIFMAATLAVGEALLSTNADEWAARRVVMLLGQAGGGQFVLAVAALAVLALACHLVITSRSARAAVLIPALALPLAGLGLDPAALIMLVVLGTGFCQTLPASAKPVALYAALEQPTYQPADLRKLSLALAPMMLAALLAMAFLVWPLMGFDMRR